jgi:hypothetical protein
MYQILGNRCKKASMCLFSLYDNKRFVFVNYKQKDMAWCQTPGRIINGRVWRVH